MPAAGQGARVEAFHADEDLEAAGTARERDEAGDAVGERVDLHQEAHRDAPSLARLDEPGEDPAPVGVPAEVVVGEEVVVRSERAVAALDRGDHLRRLARSHGATLDVDDRAERARERAAATGIERGEAAVREAPQRRGVEARHRGAAEVRQAGEGVVERLEPPADGVAEDRAPGLLDLAGDQRDAIVHQLAEAARDLAPERDPPGDVEAADQDGGAAAPEAMREVDGARHLARLHADQRDHHARPAARRQPGDPTLGQRRDRLVAEVAAQARRRERAALLQLEAQRVQARERVAQ